MVHDQRTKLIVSKQAERSRRAVDQMAPSGNQRRVDTKALSAKGQAADRAGAVEAGDVAIAARASEGPTKVVEGGKRVHRAGAAAREQRVASSGEDSVAVQKVTGRGLDPMRISVTQAKVGGAEAASQGGRDTH